MALGAASTQVALLVLGRGMVPVLAGIAVGLAGAIVLTRFMTGLLFGVSASDPVTLATVATLVAAVAAVPASCPPGAPCSSIQRWCGRND